MYKRLGQPPEAVTAVASGEAKIWMRVVGQSAEGVMEEDESVRYTDEWEREEVDPDEERVSSERRGDERQSVAHEGRQLAHAIGKDVHRQAPDQTRGDAGSGSEQLLVRCE